MPPIPEAVAKAAREKASNLREQLFAMTKPMAELEQMPVRKSASTERGCSRRCAGRS